MRTTRDVSSSETSGVSNQATLLAQDARRLHRTLIDAVVATGSIPAGSELVDRLGMTEDAIHAGLAALAAGDYLALDAGGRVSCLYPFSPTPTSHGVLIDGQRRFAMCAIDALGIPAMLARELVIAGRCADCDRTIGLSVRPGAIGAVTPPTAMVVARRDEAEPAFAACCPHTVFVCGPEHAEHSVHRITSSHALPLGEAHMRAEAIFGGLLADVMPASRLRGKEWGRPERG